MPGKYREGISHEQLIDVVNVVREWLYPPSSSPEKKEGGEA